MGSIHVSSSGRYFTDAEGDPFFWLGDTQWELFCALSPRDAVAILERRREQGFTVIQVMVTGVGDGTRPNAAGESPWLGNDPSSPNEEYFRNADHVIEAARRCGLILVLGVFHQTQRSSITCDNARAYARCVAQRYRDVPNIVWTMYPEAKPEFVPVLRELAAGLREGDGGAHMITVHPDPAPTSSSFIHDEQWLAFNMIQTCVDYGRIHAMVSEDYARTPVKPVVMAEGGYEGLQFGKVQGPLEIRRQAYWSYLAGGHHSYGHNDNWAAPAQWRSWIDSPGAQNLGVCKRILTTCPEWWDLIPDQSLFAAGEGSGLTVNAAARSAAGDWALIYLSSSEAVSIRTDRLTFEGSAEACWVDPTTGERTGIGNVPATGAMSLSAPEGWDDALVLLQKQEATGRR